MLNEIQTFFAQHLAFLAPSQSEEQLQLASIALLLEMVIADDHASDDERGLVLSIVRKSYALSTEEATAVIEQAEIRRKAATDFFEFTSLINQYCKPEQKIQLIESLWQIAYVDGVIDPQEEYLVRKIANLLHIAHADFLLAKTDCHPAEIPAYTAESKQ